MPVVFDNMEEPGSTPASLRRVDVYLVASNSDSAAGGTVDGSDISIFDRQTGLTNAAGYVGFNLRPNILIDDPPGTYYLWDVHLSDGQVWRRRITVPNGAGPYHVSDLVDSPPPVVVGGGYGFYNVRLAPYNAAGDGVTDDTVAIQAAVDDCVAAGGGVVFFPRGTYKVTSCISILRGRGVTLQGVSRYASKIVGSGLGGDGVICPQSCRDTRIEHLYLDGGGTTGAIIESSRIDGGSFSGRNLRVSDCKVGGDASSSAAYGIRIGTGADINQDIMVVDDVEFAHVGTGIQAADSGSKNSFLHMFSKLSFSSCDVGIDAFSFSLDGAVFEDQCIWFRLRSGLVEIANVTHGDSPAGTKLIEVQAGAGNNGVVLLSNVEFGVAPPSPEKVLDIDASVDGWTLIFNNFSYSNGAASVNAIISAPAAGNRLIFNSGLLLNIRIDTAGTVVWGANLTTLASYIGAVITGGGRIERFPTPDPSAGLPISMTLGAKGTVASVAGTITLPAGTFIDVTGTNTITSITATNADIGRLVILKFTSTASLTDGSNLKLGGNFAGSADDTISLICDGTNWYETARSAN